MNKDSNPKSKTPKKKEKKLAIKHKCVSLNNSTLAFEKIIMNPWLGDIKLMVLKANKQVLYISSFIFCLFRNLGFILSPQ
jgi:hypothetical protein